ncbi:hypothetical protein ACFWCB_33625 [Streptomyces sp. NPDC060048]|uniref:hypothetical protein n=1 Tax=unclassified Streptomyces TaxID=2593676 RepID=UPI0036861DC2
MIGAVAAADGIRLTTDQVPAGAVTLVASTTDDKVQRPLGLVRLRAGVALTSFLTHYQTAATSKDPAERHAALALIDSEAHYFGGPAVTKASGKIEISWILTPGTYHLLDYTLLDPARPELVRSIRVGAPTRPGTSVPRWAPDLIAAYDEGPLGRYLIGNTLDARGEFTVVNQTSQLNEVMFLRVTPGAGSSEVAACMEALAHGQQPPTYPFTGVPSGITPLSPGSTAVLSQSLEPGQYLVTSFISNRETLVKRAFEGMWKLVTLR